MNLASKTLGMLTTIIWMLFAVLLVLVFNLLYTATSGALHAALLILWIVAASAVAVLLVVSWRRMLEVRRLTRAQNAKSAPPS